MSNLQQLQFLMEICKENDAHDIWNSWRQKNPNQVIDFSRANLESFHFSFFNLRNVHFRDCYLKNANFDNAVLSNSCFRNSYLINTSFKRAKLNNACFENVCLLQSSIQEANLTNANFLRADLRFSNFTQATFYNTNMEKTVISGISLSNNRGTILVDTAIQCSHFKLCGCDIQIKNKQQLNIFIFSLQKGFTQPFLFQESTQKCQPAAKEEFISKKYKLHAQNQEIVKQPSTEQRISLKKEEIFEEESLKLKQTEIVIDDIDRVPIKNKQIFILNNIVKKPSWYLLALGIFSLIFIGFFYYERLQIYFITNQLYSKDVEVRRKTISMLKSASRKVQTNPYVIELLIAKLDENDAETKKKIIKILNMINKPALKSLTRVLYFGSKIQKLNALKVISGMYDQGLPCLDAILEILKSSDEDLKIQATKTLFKIGYLADECLPFLIRNLQSKNDLLKIESLKTLRRMRSGYLARQWILKNLHSDNDEVFRTAVISMSSWNYVSPKTISILHKKLKTTSYKNLQKSILFVFGQLVEHVDITEVYPTLKKYTENPLFTLAFEATRTIANAKEYSIIEKMLQAKNPMRRKLGVIGFSILKKYNNKVLSAFSKTLDRENDQRLLLAQLKSIRKIRINMPQLLPRLKYLANSDSFAISGAAEIAIGCVDDSSASIKWLLKRLKKKNNSYVKNALVRIGKTALPHLEKIWQAGNKKRKLDILDIIKEMRQNGTGSIDWILDSFDESSVKLRISMLRTLSSIKVKNTHSVEKVLQSLQDKNHYVRKQAIAALLSLKIKSTSEIRDVLIQNLDSKHQDLRLKSAKAIIALKLYNKEIIDSFYNDSHPQIQKLARKIIIIKQRKNK